MNWQQFKSILWLRWRLSRNQWSRGGALNAVVLIIVSIGAIALGLAGAIGGVIGGAIGLAKAPPEVILLVWDGIIAIFLFIWAVGVMTEIQRSENIDLGRLLHLPVSLRQIFFLNYIASNFTLSLALFLPGMLGLTFGLIFGISWRMIFMAPLVLSVVFMLTAWTYYLRGWLIALMINQRRRRTVIMVVTMSLLLFSQLPNLYFNVFQQGHKSHSRKTSAKPSPTTGTAVISPAVLAVHPFVPPLWVGYGAFEICRGNVLPALGGAAGALFIGALGLRGAYRSTVRFYRSESRGLRPSATSEPHPVGKKYFLETNLPMLSEETTAMVLAFLRSMLRAPEVKMALASNLFGVLILAITLFSRGFGRLGETAQLFVATGVVAFPYLGMMQLMFNMFGIDREGFRALVLLPAARQEILLAKNLAFLPFAFSIGLLLLALAAGLAHLAVPLLAAACLQLLAIFFLLSSAGNLVSILAPYRIAAGSLKPTKAPGKKMFLIVLWQIIFPLALLPALIPAGLGALSAHFGWMQPPWVDLLVSIVLAVVTAGIYAALLKPLGRFFQRRERTILQAVTQEVE